MPSQIIHDYETGSELDLTEVGLDTYCAHPSTHVQMVAYRIDQGPLRQWQRMDGPLPREYVDALTDPHVIKKAFNLQFEVQISRRVLKIAVPPVNLRCTMARAYSQSFTGGLDDVVGQLRLPTAYMKDREGKRLMKLFSEPQRVTKNQPFRWRDEMTDPDQWEMYLSYNRQDVIAEEGVEERLATYPMLDSEWELYEIDQQINERGLPVDLDFARQAFRMATERSDELQDRIRELTGVENPNSVPQLKPWLQDRGYWFDDMRADTVKKVIREGKDRIAPEAIEVLKLREWASRSSPAKYANLLEWAQGGRARFMFQFGGASRTNRWSGRGPQPQNLPRTPKVLEDHDGTKIEKVAAIIKTGDFTSLADWLDDQERMAAAKDNREIKPREPLELLVGSVRSTFQAPEGYILDICDLSAIESRVIGWLTGCKRLNKVFADDLDPYKDFAVDLYGVPYYAVTKQMRSDSKPGVLGGGYRLGGGDEYRGKRTGLWGYAENMGIDLTKEQAHKQVATFREKYVEIVNFWYELERATIACVQTGRPQMTGPVRWEMMKPYLTAILPSGRRMFYQFPKVTSYEAISRKGNPYTKYQLSYMGKDQVTKQWMRLESHGGLLIENLVQAIARDILKKGMMRAHDLGIYLVGSVHDELIAMRRLGHNGGPALDDGPGLAELKMCMRFPMHEYPGLLLDAAGFSARVYRKD